MEAYYQTIRKLADEEAQRINSQAGFVEVEVDDLVQDVIADLIEQGTDLDSLDEAGSWLRKVTRNKAMQARARRTEYGRSTPVDFQVDPEDDDPTFEAFVSKALIEDFPEDEVLDRVDGTIVGAAVDTVLDLIDSQVLDGRAQFVARRYFVEGQEPKTIADEMGVSHQVVRHLLSDAKSSLGEQLGDAQALREALYPEARRPKGQSPAVTILASLAL